MKIKFTFWAMLSFLPFFASAQNYNSAELTFPMDQNLLVRNWDDSNVVSLVYSDGYRFVVTDFSDFLGLYSSSGFLPNAIYSDTI